MQILYLWINQKNGLKNISLNFGGDILCNISNNTLTIENNPFYIKDFFCTQDFLNKSPKINSVTGIVGENGTGKSTILNSLMKIIENDQNKTFEYFIVYKEKATYFFDYSFKKKIKYNYKDITRHVPIILKVSNIDRRIFFKPLNSTAFKTIFFSNVYDIQATYSQHNSSNRIINLSTNNLSKNKSFVSNQLYDQIMFTKKYEHDLKINEKINVPKEIQIENIYPYNLPSNPKTMQHTKNIEDLFDKIIYPRLSETDEIKANSFLYETCYSIYLAFYTEVFIELVTNLSFGVTSFNYLHAFQQSAKSVQVSNSFSHHYESLKKEIEKLITNDKKSFIEQEDPDELFNSFKESMDNSINYFFDFMESLFRDVQELISLLHSINIIKKNGRYLVKSSDQNLSKIISVNEESYFKPFFNMTWTELSSGEYAFLNLFSRFYSIKNKDIENLIILIDEGDLYFHPQWQKEWLYTFMDIISYMYKKTKIQIILTTHSPFILSDLPNNNVIFLKRDKENHTYTVKNLDNNQLTFAANIHGLFTNSFFITDGLVGKFAQKKINNLIDELMNSSPEKIKSNSSRIKKEIDIIGEPIVKRKLIEMFEDKIKLDVLTINKKIDQLQRQINELKALQNEEN
ncbi:MULTISPECIES: AAA family ATPase [Bacillus cereus group]|uniref:AAA family ATPase n=1 Tax=Bacillus cereus group TaxID=86661 RepID=UPI001F5A56C2|nr:MULTISPECIES: AAA family ATPase [Bacillus cereus group]MDW3037183.1 AAA family ATPase [Bacillus pacificus]